MRKGSDVGTDFTVWRAQKRHVDRATWARAWFERVGEAVGARSQTMCGFAVTEGVDPGMVTGSYHDYSDDKDNKDQVDYQFSSLEKCPFLLNVIKRARLWVWAPVRSALFYFMFRYCLQWWWFFTSEAPSWVLLLNIFCLFVSMPCLKAFASFLHWF